MSRLPLYTNASMGGFPRSRGDEPKRLLPSWLLKKFSPLTRG